jgi:hypothetical protein
LAPLMASVILRISAASSVIFSLSQARTQAPLSLRMVS